MLRRKKKVEGEEIKPKKEYIFEGIKCDSSLEVYCHKRLKEEGILYDFHPKPFVFLESFISSSVSYEPDKRAGDGLYVKTNKIRLFSYTTDFADPHLRWIIESKGYKRSEFSLRWKMFKYHLKTNYIETNLFLPANQKQVDEAIQTILNLPLSKHVSSECPKLFNV